jgi:DUF1016 N-terminal domain
VGKRRAPSIAKRSTPELPVGQLVADLRELIDAARLRIVTAANSELTLIYWRIGRRIQSDILSGERAAYGRAIVATVSQQLTAEYGQGFTYTPLTRMAGFFEAVPDNGLAVPTPEHARWSRRLFRMSFHLGLQGLAALSGSWLRCRSKKNTTVCTTTARNGTMHGRMKEREDASPYTQRFRSRRGQS